MGVPATLLLMQVTRMPYTGGGGSPPEEPETPEQKRRRRRITICLAVFCAVLTIGAIAYCLYSMNKSADQLRVLYAPSPKA